MFESHSNDEYLKAPITWQLLYRMISVIDQHQTRIIFDKPRTTTMGGKLVRNPRAHRRAGGTSNYKPTSLPDNVYKAWNYFSTNAEAINKFLYNAKARPAAKGVFVYLKAGGTSEKRRTTFFKSSYYRLLVEQVAEFSVNLTARYRPDQRVAIRLVGPGYRGLGSNPDVSITKDNELVHSFSRDEWPEMRELIGKLS